MKGENMNYYPKLKSLIDKIDELLKIPDLTADSKEFVDWQIRTELFLSRCYGQESTQMKRFQHTEFVPYFDFDNRNERNKKCRDGLEKTKEIFEIYLDEIEEDNFNRTMDSIHGKLSRPQLSVAIPKIEEKVISGKIIMKKKYQVFISSTYEDLKEERAAVTQCLLNNNCIPVGMEQFPASNMSQMEYIKKMLDDCDYYILIIGGRYGSLDDDGIGYTEKEYNYAIQKGIPVMAFVNAHPEKLPNEKCEQTDAGREKFKAFRNRVWKNKKLVKGYENIGDLKTYVVDAINAAIRECPGIGWVRGDSIPEMNEQTFDKMFEKKLAEHTATDEEFQEMLDEIFGDSKKQDNEKKTILCPTLAFQSPSSPICRHRGRESVLHLPGDVRSETPEGVGAGGEVDSEKVK